MRPRAYLEPVRELLTDAELRRAVVLLGPRRVGKTILIHHLIADLLAQGVDGRRIAYVEMDHPLLHGQTLQALVACIEAATGPRDGLRYLFFDEIQSLKDWEKHLKPLVDHRPDLRILVSGSAAAALKRKSTESGAGRFTDFLLPPLTFSEYLTLRDEPPGMVIERTGDAWLLKHLDLDTLNQQFVRYVHWGGFPELALSSTVQRDPGRFVRSDIVDKVLLRDLPQLYGIQDIQELNALFTRLAFNTAQEVSLEELSKRTGVAKPTMVRYVEYLEAAFLLRRVWRVDQDGQRYRRERGFKVYLTNPAMYTGLFGATDPEHPDFGHLVETALYAQRFHEGARLNYARWGKGQEVDMVVTGPALRPVEAIEIKWSDRPVEDAQATAALRQFTAQHRLPRAICTTRTQTVGLTTDGSSPTQFVPAAVLAYLWGMQAVERRLGVHAIQRLLDRL